MEIWAKFLALTARRSLPILASYLIKNEPISPRALKDIVLAQRKLFQITCSFEDLNDNHYPESEGPYLFVILNQTSLVESLLIPDAVHVARYKTFANIGFLLLPFIGWTCYAYGAIPVLPGWPWQTRRAVTSACDFLKQSRSHALYMSVEGRRSPDGALSTYRHGCARIAIETGATIVPIVVYGARECLPYGQWQIRPGHCLVKNLPKISTAKSLGPNDFPRLTALLRETAEIEFSHLTHAARRPTRPSTQP